MNSWQRITLVSLILIGSTITFGYWSINQFDNVLNDLSAPHVANVLTASSPLKTDEDLVSTSPEILATSTTSDDLKLFFTFPQKEDKIYIGCTYLIPWQSSTTIVSLRTALIDAGTGEAAGPITSGIAKENFIENNSQNLNWKVGGVWPGEYYITVSKINNTEVNFRSKVFEIKKIPEGLNAEEQKNICNN